MTEQPQSEPGLDDLAWTVGDRFRKARETRTKLSRAGMAEAVGCSRDTIQNLEERTTLPKAYFVGAYSRITGVPETYLRGEPDRTPLYLKPLGGAGRTRTDGQGINSPHLTLVRQAA